MQDIVNTLDCPLCDGEIREIPFEEVDAREMCEIFAMTGNQAVNDAYLFAAPDKLFCQVGSNEACATRDEV